MNSQIFRCNKIGFEPICVNDSYAAIMFKLNFDIGITFVTNNFVRPRPLWGQFCRENCVRQAKLAVALKNCGCSMRVKLFAGSIGGILVALASHVTLKKQFSDEVIG
jgi:hypothetical protein